MRYPVFDWFKDKKGTFYLFKTEFQAKKTVCYKSRHAIKKLDSNTTRTLEIIGMGVILFDYFSNVLKKAVHLTQLNKTGV